MEALAARGKWQAGCALWGVLQGKCHVPQRDTAHLLCKRSTEAGRGQLHPWAESVQLQDPAPS